MVTDTLMDWFLAALMHDIGKTIISKEGWWGKHEDLDYSFDAAQYPTSASVGIGYGKLLDQEVIERVRAHGERPNPQRSPFENALSIADHLQKAMYESETKGGEILETLVRRVFPVSRLNPPFYPYYGVPTAWTESRSASLVRDIEAEMQRWNGRPTLHELLALERKLLHSPHTTPNIPHNSLAFHQRFTAIFFYFVYKQLIQLSSIYDWRRLELSVVTIRPEHLSLFYRLKDVKAHEVSIRQQLRQGLFDGFFTRYAADLPQITVEDNPFEFYGRDAVAVVVDNGKALLECLQNIVDEDETESLRHMNVQVVPFTINAPDGWKPGAKGFSVPPKNVSRDDRQAYCLFSKRAARFERSVTPRCERCGQPLDPVEASAGSICSPCSALLKQTEGVGGQIESLFPETERRGFVFLNLPEDLLGEAKRQADVMLAELKQDSQRFKPKPESTDAECAEALAQIQSTPTGIFEYLQAVMEIQAFQDVREQFPDVYPLIQFPNLMIWVTSESQYWDFVAKVGDLLQRLHLSSSLSGLLCHPRTPFWSLMDRLTTFSKQGGVYQRGAFYDLSGGEIVVFTDEEVKAIRDLARMAFSDMAFKSQLNALVQLARMATLRELELEIDERDNLRKLRSDFCAALKSALNRMTGDDQRARDKRALFIKNIVRLAGFKSERPAASSSTPERRR